MQPFSIKIVSARRNTFWYADKIGQEFLVTGVDTPDDETFEPQFSVKRDDYSLASYVPWDDCEIVLTPVQADVATGCTCNSSTEYLKDGEWLCSFCHLPRH
jgi:hypothetical protein